MWARKRGHKSEGCGCGQLGGLCFVRRGVGLRGRVKGFGWMMICWRDLGGVGLEFGAWWTIWREWLGGEGWFGFRAFACGSRGRRWGLRELLQKNASWKCCYLLARIGEGYQVDSRV